MSVPNAAAGPDVAGAVYGQLIVTALVASLSEYRGASTGEIFMAVVLTLPVFWLAHVYADAVAQRLRQEHPLTLSDVLRFARHKSPIAQAAAPALAALALGWTGLVSRTVSVDLAIGAGVAALLALGVVIGRRSHMSPLGTVGAVCLNGAFGLAIVAMKVLVD